MIPYGLTWALFGDLPLWLIGLIVAPLYTYNFCLLGVVIGKCGRSPFLSLLLFVPGAVIPLLAWLAWGRWPERKPPA